MAKIKSVQRGNIFSQIEAVRTPLSRHNLSYPTRFDCNMGELIPFYVQDVTPGVNMMASAGFFGRMMPTISPIMQDIDLEVRYFFVPNRLVWDNFEDYILRVGDHLHPYIGVDYRLDQKVPYLMDLISNLGNESMVDDDVQHDYLLAVDALPYSAYYLIWNEYFRDENVQNEIEIPKSSDGNIYNADEMIILHCDWKKDYFTSALPWTQRGNMSQFVGDVYLKNPNGNKLPQLIRNSAGSLIGGPYGDDQQSTNGVNSVGQTVLVPSKGGIPDGPNSGQLGYRTNYFTENNDTFTKGEVGDAWLDPNGTFAVAFSINELRMANAVQRFLERSALAGNRYTEYIMGMFGVHCSDSRLQRPEYLGGGSVPFSVSEVMQNEQAQLDSDGDPYDGSTPQGNLAGIGKVAGRFGFNKPMFFPEYGWVIGLAYLRPKAMYMNGVSRRHIIGVCDDQDHDVSTQFENYEIYYNPYFENLGEQAIFNVELYNSPNVADTFGGSLANRQGWDKSTFAYQSMNAYRKYRNGEVHGEFRDTLKYWTLAREFSAVPQLNDSFLKCNPSRRIFAVEDESNHFIFEVYNKVDAVLPMSAYSTPKL